MVGDKVGSPPWSAAHRRNQVGVHLAAQGVDGAHCASLYGRVTRGDSSTRLTSIWCSNATSHLSTAPLTGAALPGSGEQASGIWPFAGKQAGGRVQANPAGAGQVDLAPGVQVGEVGFGAAGAVQRFDVGQAGSDSRTQSGCQAQVAQHLRQQPARIAAGAAGQGEVSSGGLHARLQADQVADGVVDFFWLSATRKFTVPTG